jgi:hypothetical protein
MTTQTSTATATRTQTARGHAHTVTNEAGVSTTRTAKLGRAFAGVTSWDGLNGGPSFRISAVYPVHPDVIAVLVFEVEA